MNDIELAIKKAKEEGGYTRIWFYGRGDDPSPILLDPKFFQSLGKSLGWYKTGLESHNYGVPQWRYEWHRFIDHLAEGKADSFFTDLIKK